MNSQIMRRAGVSRVEIVDALKVVENETFEIPTKLSTYVEYLCNKEFFGRAKEF